jgi:hypothetical protein
LWFARYAFFPILFGGLLRTMIGKSAIDAQEQAVQADKFAVASMSEGEIKRIDKETGKSRSSTDLCRTWICRA